MREFSRAFRAMNTEVMATIATDASLHLEAEAALAEVEALFRRNEAVMSRFLPDSELSRLNRSATRPFAASQLLFQVVEEALLAAYATGGVFDPTILGALIGAGYDRSFELLKGRHDAGLPRLQTKPEAVGQGSVQEHGRVCSWRDVKLDRSRQTILLPAGCGLDLGGIGKGWTVDRAADLLSPFANFAVDAGGDLYAAGIQADGTNWTVGVEDPFERDRNLFVLALKDRAVATSTVRRRRWSRNGLEQHHLIDPRTGRSSESGVAAATVIADSVGRAEVLAKVSLLLGPRAGRRFLAAQPGVEGMLVMADGQIDLSYGLHEVLHAA